MTRDSIDNEAPCLFYRIAKTLCFSNRGHGLYLSSPTEIQKFSVSSQFW